MLIRFYRVCFVCVTASTPSHLSAKGGGVARQRGGSKRCIYALWVLSTSCDLKSKVLLNWNNHPSSVGKWTNLLALFFRLLWLHTHVGRHVAHSDSYTINLHVQPNRIREFPKPTACLPLTVIPCTYLRACLDVCIKPAPPPFLCRTNMLVCG